MKLCVSLMRSALSWTFEISFEMYEATFARLGLLPNFLTYSSAACIFAAGPVTVLIFSSAFRSSSGTFAACAAGCGLCAEVRAGAVRIAIAHRHIARIVINVSRMFNLFFFVVWSHLPVARGPRQTAHYTRR